MDAIIQFVIDRYHQERAVIAGAPIAFLLCVLVAGAVLYFAVHLYFRHELSSRDAIIGVHEERHKWKDEQLKNLAASPSLRLWSRVNAG